MEFKHTKILHVYWGGTLPYLRFMTLKTFINHNPDWKIMFWYPKYPNHKITWKSSEQTYHYSCKDFLSEVNKLSSITKTIIDFRDYGLNNDISEIHKADFVRLYQLSTLGGVWSDMDVFYIRPINDLYVNTRENKNIKTLYCHIPKLKYGHSVGFLAALQENKFFKTLLELQKKNIIQLIINV